MATVFVGSNSPYFTPFSSHYDSGAEINFFGVDVDGDQTVHNEGAGITSFNIDIRGENLIPTYSGFDIVPYDIDDVSLDTSEIGSKVNVTLTPYINELNGFRSFRIDISGKFEIGPALDIKYREGLDNVKSVNSLDDVPEGASITRLIKPGGIAETFIKFTVLAEDISYDFSVPMVVKPIWGQSFNGGPILAASRKGDSGTGHGSYPPRSNNEGSPDVFIDGIAAHTVTHSWKSHCNPEPRCHGGSTSTGSGGVYINGQPLARVSDSVDCGSKLAQGSETVFSG